MLLAGPASRRFTYKVGLSDLFVSTPHLSVITLVRRSASAAISPWVPLITFSCQLSCVRVGVVEILIIKLRLILLKLGKKGLDVDFSCPRDLLGLNLALKRRISSPIAFGKTNRALRVLLRLWLYLVALYFQRDIPDLYLDVRDFLKWIRDLLLQVLERGVICFDLDGFVNEFKLVVWKFIDTLIRNVSVWALWSLCLSPDFVRRLSYVLGAVRLLSICWHLSASALQRNHLVFKDDAVHFLTGLLDCGLSANDGRRVCRCSH